MTILAALTSPSDVIHGSRFFGLAANTTAAQIAPYAKEGFDVQELSPARTDFTASSSLWISFYFYSPLTSWASCVPIHFRLGTDRVFGMQYNGAETLVFQRVDSSNVLTTVATITTAQARRIRIDIEINMAASGGAYRIYEDLTLVGEFTGDTRARSTLLTQMDNILWSAEDSVATRFTISGCFISTTDTRDMTFEQLAVTGAGANTDWSGAFSDLDELGIPDDSDFISADTINDISTYTLENHNAAFASGFAVEALVVNARARGSNFLRPVARSGTVNGEATGTQLDKTHKPVRGVFHNDPNTGVAWTHTGINGAEIGVKLASAA
jgi:hypothetical protein